MKKKFAVLVATVLIFAMSFTSFAAVTNITKFVGDDGYTYFFGKFDKNTDTDVGLEIDGKEYNLNNPDKKDVFDTAVSAWDKAVKNGAFGIGIKGKDGFKGEKQVKAYSKVNEEKTYYNKDLSYNTEEKPTVIVPPVVIPEIKMTEYGLVKYLNKKPNTGVYETQIKKNAEALVVDSTTQELKQKGGQPFIGFQDKYVADCNISKHYESPYVRFDISKLTSIPDDKLVVIDYVLFRHGGSILEQNIYMEGLTKESNYFDSRRCYMNNKYKSSYNGKNNAHDPLYVRFNVTNYIKNKINLNEKTATILFTEEVGDANYREQIAAGSGVAQMGYLGMGTYAPKLTIIDKASYEGVDKDEEFKPIYREPELNFNDYGSIEHNIKNGTAKYVEKETSTSATKANEPAVVLKELSKAKENNLTCNIAYATFDITNLKGINEDTLILIDYSTFRHGGTIDNQAVYVEGVYNEADKLSYDKNILGEKYVYAYSKDKNNDANTPQVGVFNVTNYLKNKINSGETTATFLFVLDLKDNPSYMQGTSQHSGYVGFGPTYKPHLTYVKKDMYKGADKNEAFVPFYAEKDIVLSQYGTIHYSPAGEIDESKGLTFTNENPMTDDGADLYPMVENGKIVDISYLQFDISNLKGINSNRKVYLNFTQRRKGTAGANFGILTGVATETSDVTNSSINAWLPDDSVVNYEFEVKGIGQGQSMQMIKEKIDVTDYVKNRIAAGEKTVTFMFRAKNTNENQSERTAIGIYAPHNKVSLTCGI